MHCIFIENYASRCHGLHLSVLNIKTTDTYLPNHSAIETKHVLCIWLQS